MQKGKIAAIKRNAGWLGRNGGHTLLISFPSPSLSAILRSMKDTLKQYLHLRTQLSEEKARLEKRLSEIQRALGGETPTPFRANRTALAIPRKLRRAKKTATKRIKNPMSLREAILKVTNGKPLTKKEIFDAVQKLGYKFGGKKPMTSINPILYGKNPKFKRKGGKFSPA